MRQGRTIESFAAELQRQASSRQDYLAPCEIINMTPADDEVQMSISGLPEPMGIREVAHIQLSEYTDIPYKYYTKMMSSPELLAQNVNHWLHQEDVRQKNKMIRVLDGSVRAFLSDRYRKIDNDQLAEAVLPIISKLPDAYIESCEITERRMYIKVVNPKLTREIAVGDAVQSGLVISNSEVGLGSVSVAPLVYRLVCKNGMIAVDNRVRRYHVGRVLEGEENTAVFQKDTLEADDLALMLKLRDTVNEAVSEAGFDRIVKSLREARGAKIEAPQVAKVVELVSQTNGITKSESQGVLGYLAAGGDLSLYGLGNAVTRYAQDVTDYDRSTELENIGWKVTTLPPQRWKAIVSEAGKESI